MVLEGFKEGRVGEEYGKEQLTQTFLKVIWKLITVEAS